MASKESDARLFRAYGEMKGRMAVDEVLAARREAVRGRRTYARPLRSLAVTLRANDSRLPDGGWCGWMHWPDDPMIDRTYSMRSVLLNGENVAALCGPVVIAWPGVSVDAAAQMFGVNRTTIHRWSKSGKVEMDAWERSRRDLRDDPHPPAHSSGGRGGDDPHASAASPAERGGAWPPGERGGEWHRAEKRVWTRLPVLPGGEVWSMDWGPDAMRLSDLIPRGWRQALRRVPRFGAPPSVTHLLECPSCGRWSSKLYWPMPVWTVGEAMGEEATKGRSDGATEGGREGFVCRRCAGLIYESAERGSRPAPGRRVNTWDRYVKRMSGGVLRGREVEGADGSRLSAIGEKRREGVEGDG